MASTRLWPATEHRLRKGRLTGPIRVDHCPGPQEIWVAHVPDWHAIPPAPGAATIPTVDFLPGGAASTGRLRWVAASAIASALHFRMYRIASTLTMKPPSRRVPGLGWNRRTTAIERDGPGRAGWLAWRICSGRGRCPSNGKTAERQRSQHQEVKDECDAWRIEKAVEQPHDDKSRQGTRHGRSQVMVACIANRESPTSRHQQQRKQGQPHPALFE